VPPIGDAGRLVTLVAELQAPHTVQLNGRHGQLRLGVLALNRLQQRDPIEHERARQVDRVDAAAFAGAVDAGRA
jgi:hypothetical protein